MNLLHYPLKRGNSTARSNEQKNSRTNELLSTFSLCYDGKKLGNKFSAQRRWITDIYEKSLPAIDQKRDFLHNLAQVADFFHTAWYMEDVEQTHHIKSIEKHPEGKFALFLIQYLKDANSKLSVPILARFYSQSIEQESIDDFVKTAKACAAFFTLWRSARSTSGLDEIYRKFFRGSNKNDPVNVDRHSWRDHSKPISPQNIKQYFLEVLKHNKIYEKDAWITESEPFLLYNTAPQKICRFVLFVAGHDRVLDKSNPGLTTQGNRGTFSLLDLDRWKATDFKSIEHVAPQNPPSEHDWDPNIYSENRVDKIGNLILLPIDINQYLNNKGWGVKFLHYSHLGVRENKKIEELKKDADKKGIVLSQRATKSLSKANYNCTIEPILELGIGGSWDAKLIDERTQQIKDIAWETLMSWLKI